MTAATRAAAGTGSDPEPGKGAAMAAKEEWLVFYHEGKEICSYTVAGTFAGEKEETIKLLAYEKGIPEQEIVCSIVKR